MVEIIYVDAIYFYQQTRQINLPGTGVFSYTIFLASPESIDLI